MYGGGGGGAMPYGMVPMQPYGYVPLRPGQQEALMQAYAAGMGLAYAPYAQHHGGGMAVQMGPAGGMQVCVGVWGRGCVCRCPGRGKGGCGRGSLVGLCAPAALGGPSLSLRSRRASAAVLLAWRTPPCCQPLCATCAPRSAGDQCC
jgi:hypothetical protein